MTIRRIDPRTLTRASACDRPECIPKGRPRGSKLDGIRYERKLAAALPWAKHGQWWSFFAAGEAGFCQTDLLIERASYAIVLEAKLSWTEEGHEQLEELYLPVVEHALGKPVLGVQVTLRLRRETPLDSVCASLPTAVARAASGKRAVFHWLGKSAIIGVEMPGARLEPRRMLRTPSPIARVPA